MLENCENPGNIKRNMIFNKTSSVAGAGAGAEMGAGGQDGGGGRGFIGLFIVCLLDFSLVCKVIAYRELILTKMNIKILLQLDFGLM